MMVLAVIVVLVAIAAVVGNVRRQKFSRMGMDTVNGVNLQQALKPYRLTGSLSSRYK
jgi:hypothetical protein